MILQRKRGPGDRAWKSRNRKLTHYSLLGWGTEVARCEHRGSSEKKALGIMAIHRKGSEQEQRTVAARPNQSSL
jgi:hypothetical protein